jgi:hypothetical protein
MIDNSDKSTFLDMNALIDGSYCLGKGDRTGEANTRESRNKLRGFDSENV